MLRVEFRDLTRGPVVTDGELESGDPAFDGLDLKLAGPVTIRGRLQATDGEDFLWRGAIRATIRGECRRCLTEVRIPVDADVDVLFSTDPDAADDPSVYPLPVATTHVDLAPAVREELALAAPTYVLCRDDCAGLCPKCGADLNAGPCGCVRSAEQG
jgi:DUF177 domain-containing protein